MATTLQRLRTVLRRPLPSWFGLLLLPPLAVWTFGQLSAIGNPAIGVQRADKAPELQLSRLIEAVKKDLASAELARIDRKEAPLFILNDVDLEISFVVRSSVDATGKVALEFVAVDSTTSWGAERIQKVRVNLTSAPVMREQQAATISDKPLVPMRPRADPCGAIPQQ